MKKIGKIVHVLLGKANPNTMNGVNKVVHYLATTQHYMGYDVEVWGISFSKKPPTHYHEYLLRIFPANKLRFYLCSDIRNSLKNLSTGTVVHFHSVFIPEFYVIAFFLQKSNIPYCITPHGGYSIRALRRNWVVKHLYISLFESSLLRHAALIHAIGETEVEHILKIIRHNNICLVPNGQDFNYLQFKRSVMKAERPVFGFLGRLDSTHKGLDLVVEGFSAYKKHGGQGSLWFIGDGIDRKKLHSKTEHLGINHSVCFWGARFGEEKLQFLDNIDIFLHASRWDVTPTACLEAAALSKPLLISRETNLGSFLEAYSAGWVLPENTPEQITKTMLNVEQEFRKNSFKEYGQSARKMIEAEFNWSNIAKKLVEAYEGVL